MKVLKFAGATVAALTLTCAASAANAAVYTVTFQGVTFSLNQDTPTHATFGIAGANAATGDWAGVPYLGAFAFNNLGPSQLTATLISPPGTPTPSVFGGLNANSGCDGSGAAFICFNFVPNIAVSSNMMFNIVATTGTFSLPSGGPDLKIFFSSSPTVDDQTTKIGSLFSAPIPQGGGVVPEPATWAMLIMGFGMVGAGMRIRRRSLATA